jgi:hypothetical protein
MRTNVDEYVNSHGKAPRGSGMWAFEVNGTDGDGRYTSETYFISGKFADAKREAARRLKQDVGGVKQVVEVKVLP